MTIAYPIAIPFLSPSGVAMQAAINDLNARLAKLEPKAAPPKCQTCVHESSCAEHGVCAPDDCEEEYKAKPATAPDPQLKFATSGNGVTASATEVEGPPAHRKCPACGHPVLHRYSASLKSWLAVEYHDCKIPKPAAPGADAAVHQIVHLVRNHLAENTSIEISEYFDTCCARVVIKAIRAGQLPGIIYDEDMVRKHDLVAEIMREQQAEIADLKAKLAATKPTGPMQDGIPRTDHVICPHCTCQFQAISQDAQGLFDNIRADLALCEAENREKQAAIEKFMDSENELGALMVKAAEETARVTAERDGLNATICANAEEMNRAVGWRSRFAACQEQAEKNARMCDKLTAELAEARARKFAVTLPKRMDMDDTNYAWLHAESVEAAIVAAGGEVAPTTEITGPRSGSGASNC